MNVTILLEGEPVGGIEDQEKWICQQIENAGGQVYFMYNDEPPMSTTATSTSTASG